MRSKFEILFISITVIITLVLFLVIGSMVLVTTPQGFMESLFSSEFAYSIWLTIYTSFISAALVVLCSIPMAYSLARLEFPGKWFFRIILDVPMALPEIVVGIALLMFLENYGIGGMLDSFGIKFVFNTLGIIIAEFFIALPYAIKMLHSTFNYIDTRYEFVSRSLGYSDFETFYKITLPLSKQGLFTTIIITLARCIGTFAAVLFVGGGILHKTDIHFNVFAFIYWKYGYGDNSRNSISHNICNTIAIMERYAPETYNQ